MNLAPEKGRAETAPQLTTSLLIATDSLFPRPGPEGSTAAPSQPPRARGQEPEAPSHHSREWYGADPRDWDLVDGEFVYNRR